MSLILALKTLAMLAMAIVMAMALLALIARFNGPDDED